MRKYKTLPYFLIAALIIIADQITKVLIALNLTENESISIIGDLLLFRFIYNKGGAMGTMVGPSWVYTILTLVALFLIIRFFILSKPDGKFVKVSLAMIMGGAIGNLADRLFYGKVVDFIDVDIPDIAMIGLYRWYTFNIADSAISVGLVMFAISLFFRHEPQPLVDQYPEAKAPVQTDPDGR
jgi:signal peptidase II